MRRLFTYSLLLFTVLSFAQVKPKQDKDQIKGNKEFNENDYVDAEASYRISRSKSPTKSSSAYNLGNAIYRQKSNAEAAYAYSDAIRDARTKQQKHMAYHNLGNVFMKEKEYQNAVEAYKHALRNDPTDEQTRYNLALAKDMLKKNPPKQQPPKDKDKDKDKKDQNKDNKSDPYKGGGKDNKDKGDNKEPNKDNKGDQKDQKDKGGQGDQKDKGEGKPKEEGDNKEQGKPKPEPGQSPSKQRMDNLLDAMNNEEKKIQDKVNTRKVRVRPTKQEKDW